MWVYSNGENTNYLYAFINYELADVVLANYSVGALSVESSQRDTKRSASKQNRSVPFIANARTRGIEIESQKPWVAEGEKGTPLLSLWTIKQTP